MKLICLYLFYFYNSPWRDWKWHLYSTKSIYSDKEFLAFFLNLSCGNRKLNKGKNSDNISSVSVEIIKEFDCCRPAESQAEQRKHILTGKLGRMMLHHWCVSMHVCVCVRVFLFVEVGQAPQFGCDRCCPVSTSSVHKPLPSPPAPRCLFSPPFFILSSEPGCNRDSTCQSFRSVQREKCVCVC